MSSINTQDWEPVVIRKKQTSASKNRAPGTFQSELKHNSGKNAQHPKDDVRKYDGDDIPKIKKVSTSLKTNLINARQAKGWTQKELAQRVNEKPSVISQYESGQAIPNNGIINKLEKALGSKIRPSKSGK